MTSVCLVCVALPFIAVVYLLSVLTTKVLPNDQRPVTEIRLHVN